MSRIEGLTPLRGLAALWVALFHADVILFFRQFGPLLFVGLSLASAHLVHSLVEKRARVWLFERLTYARLRA